MKNNKSLNQLSAKDLQISLLLSQSIIFLSAVILSVFLFDHYSYWFKLFSFDVKEIFLYGCLPSLLLVGFSLTLQKLLPPSYLDDGGINRRIFKNKSVSYIFVVTLFIAISEEMLFRGVIQTSFGYVAASVIFALVHYRYLRKIVLFLSVVILSFFIGYLFKITGNLFVPMTTHFLNNFILGIFIRQQT